MMYEERCCEDCEFFTPSVFPLSLVGYCDVYETGVNETDEVCDEFEEKY